MDGPRRNWRGEREREREREIKGSEREMRES